MENKLCPFLNMQPCRKDECAMYLTSDSISINSPDGEYREIEADIFKGFSKTQCALAITGALAVFQNLGFKIS